VFGQAVSDLHHGAWNCDGVPLTDVKRSSVLSVQGKGSQGKSSGSIAPLRFTISTRRAFG
jgi:hypothetical protein